MNKNTKRLMKQAAQSLPVRFQESFNYEYVDFNEKIPEHMDVLKQRQKLEPSFQFPKGAKLKKVNQEFSPVNHYRSIKRIYNTQAKGNLSLAIKLYYQEDQRRRKSFEDKFPGKHKELEMILRKSFLKEQQTQLYNKQPMAI